MVRLADFRHYALPQRPIEFWVGFFDLFLIPAARLSRLDGIEAQAPSFRAKQAKGRNVVA